MTSLTSSNKVRAVYSKIVRKVISEHTNIQQFLTLIPDFRFTIGSCRMIAISYGIPLPSEEDAMDIYEDGLDNIIYACESYSVPIDCGRRRLSALEQGDEPLCMCKCKRCDKIKENLRKRGTLDDNLYKFGMFDIESLLNHFSD